MNHFYKYWTIGLLSLCAILLMGHSITLGKSQMSAETRMAMAEIAGNTSAPIATPSPECTTAPPQPDMASATNRLYLPLIHATQQNGQGDPCATPTASLDETDTQLFQKLDAVFAAFASDSDKIWNSTFRFDQDTMLYVRKDETSDLYGYLIGHPNAEQLESAQLVTLPADISLPPVYRLDALPNAAELAEVPFFDFEFPIGSETAFVLKYNSPEIEEFTSPTNDDWSLFAVHEGFHRYQIQNWNEALSNQDYANYPVTAENLALVMLENRLLIAGIETSNAISRTEALQMFVAVRDLRIETYPQVATLDNPQENSEGTARYVEHGLGTLLNMPSINLDTFGQYLASMQTEEAVSRDIRGTFFFGRFYDSGAALGRLLDLQGVDWKPLVANEKTLFEIAKSDIGLADRAALVAQAKERYNYSELLVLGEKGEEVAKGEPKDPFAPQ